jgi:hypothetical protein
MSNLPKFTIGIPTYNRAGFLRRAIESALDQTYPNVEVLVSDNASTDDTSDVVRSFGDRVRYHQNSENIQAWPNFAKLTELASGEYFSWLQDDDLVFPEFVSRAVKGLTESKDIALYCAFVYNSTSYTTFSRPTVYGPPVALDWMHGGLRILSGSTVIPLTFFVSLATPPSIAAPTDVLRKAVAHSLADSGCILYNERIILAHAALAGRVAIDPWAGAIFFQHEEQACMRLANTNFQEFTRQWIIMANRLGEIMESVPDDWKANAQSTFREVSVLDRLRWLDLESPPEASWKSVHPLAHSMRELLIDSLPVPEQEKYRSTVDLAETEAGTNGLAGLKWVARQVTPPALWQLLRTLKPQNAASNSF